MIQVENLTIQSGPFLLEGVTFEIPQGEYAVLMGRTGCGKTTLLEAICGLKSVKKGAIKICGKDVTHAKPALRDIGFVPQEGALFPTMTVAEQIGFSLNIRKWKPAEVTERVEELSELLGITHLLKRYPRGLSGGERQRVALGRALAAKPNVLCLDEPLSALDESTRLDMYQVLASVRDHYHTTTLHITHSSEEACQLGDVLFRFNDGKVVSETQPQPTISSPAPATPK